MPDALLATASTANTLSDAQHARVFALLEEGKLTQQQIGEQVGCTQQNVSVIAQNLGLAPKLRLRAKGHHFVQAWLDAVPAAIAHGDIRPMERALLYGGHLEPLASEANRPVVIQIGVALAPLLSEPPAVSVASLDTEAVVQAKAVPAVGAEG